ncbi:right-handed parallel beta-helix repeat-containing protein [Streptomyces graminilatus]|uniref:right-handed parallel beta-helix repeat-containing protein n=1 Tax=Streptomyces graminilatus TaxID=1464070 RepID=UPI0006E32DA4|nr:right-handed parallel beta-helix repeat-containing protein [Streptomyces graminilatus]
MKRTIRAMSMTVTVLTALAAVSVAAPPAVAADAGQADLAAWQRTGKPGRLIVIRPGAVDLVRGGVRENSLSPGGAEVPMSWLAANTGPDWIAQDGEDPSAVQVEAAVLLAPGTTLKIGEVTKKVLFTAGHDEASTTWIRGSRAFVDIRDTTLAAAGPDGGDLAEDAPMRPYIYMGAGGRLDIAGTTVSGFGLPGKAPARFSGVTWGKGSTGSAVGSTFQGNRTGLRLAGSDGVELDHVTVEESTEDGIVLNGDTGTRITGLTARGNGRNGVSVGGTDGRSLSGITTRDNKGIGVRAAPQKGLSLARPDSRSDQGGGIRLLSCANCTVTDATVQHTKVAVSVAGPGSKVTVKKPQLTGGRTGISLGEDIGSATVTDGRVSDFDRGITVSGPRVTVVGTRIDGSRTGISVNGKARGAVLRNVTVDGGRAGVTAAATTTGVSLTGVRITNVSGKGLASASPGLRVKGSSVAGAGTAVDLGAAATLDGLAVTGAHRGIHLAKEVKATGTELNILAELKGIQADQGAVIDITDSLVRAPRALVGDGRILRHGSTEATLPPFPWLGFAAIVALLSAIALQTIHQVRHRRTPRPSVARHVRNTA